MGPTKAIVRAQTLYEALGGKLIKDGFVSRQEVEEYVNHHYLVLPVVDKRGQPWLIDGGWSIVFVEHNTKPYTAKGFTSPDVRIVEAWVFETRKWPWSQIVSAARPADMNSMPGWR